MHGSIFLYIQKLTWLSIILVYFGTACQKTSTEVVNARQTTGSKNPLLIVSRVDDQSKGARINVPDDLSALAGTLQIEEGASVVGQDLTRALAIPDGTISAGPSVNVSSQVAVDANSIGRLEISIPFSGLSLRLAADYLVVMYQVTDAEGKVLIGVLPPSQFRTDSGRIIFKMVGFGNYQAARVPLEITELVKVKTEDTKVLTKTQQTLTALRPSFNIAPGTYNADQSVVLSSGTEGAVIHYTIDGTSPTPASLVYAAPIPVNGHGAAVTIRALAMKDGLQTSELAVGTYKITYLPAVKPALSPAPGTFSADFLLSLSTATPDAKIYFSIDGSTPTAASTLYTAPIAMTGSGLNLTIKAVAIKANLLTSDAIEGTYIIAAPAAAPPSVPPPVFTSLLKTGDGSDGSVNDAEKSGTSALWTLSASDYTTVSYSQPQLDASGTLVCDVALTYGQSAIPSASALSSDGSYVLCAKLENAGTVAQYGKSEAIVRDVAAPTVTSFLPANEASDSMIAAGEISSTSALVALVASSFTIDDFTAALSDTGGSLVCDSSQSYALSDAPLISSIASDGAYAVCVRLKDAAGNTTYAKSGSISRDSTGPSFTSLNGAFGAGDGTIGAAEAAASDPAWTLAASGYTTASYTPALSAAPASITCDASQSYSATTLPTISSLSSDGTYTVCVKLVNAAGTPAFGKSSAVVRDTAPATVDSFTNASAASDGFVNDIEKSSSAAAWSIVTTGASTINYTIALDNVGDSLVCDGSKTYSESSIPLISSLSGQGELSACAKLVDAAGNTSYGKAQLLVRDTVAPVFTSLQGANEASDGIITSAESSQVSSLFTLTASGFTSAAYTAPLTTPAGVVCDGTLTYGAASIPAINALTTDDSYVVCVKLSDTAGNASFGKSQVITRATAGPLFTSLSKTASASDGFINDSEKTGTTPLWILTQTGSTTTSYTVPLDNTSNAVNCAVQTYSESGVARAVDLPSDGPWVICVKLDDGLGQYAYGKSDPIVRDVDLPVFTSLAPANAALDGYIDASEKLQVAALYTLAASGQSTTAYTSPIDDTGASAVCNGSQTYDQASIASPAAQTVDGPSVICVKLSDAAGNTIYGKSAQVVRDSVAPTFTSLNGANEASDNLISSGEENATNPLASLIASGQTAADYTAALDDTAGALVCDASHTYNQTSVPPINSIGIDGTFALCVRLKDTAGNVSYGKSQQFTRSVGGPSFTSLAGANEASDGTIKAGEESSTSPAWTLNAAAYTSVSYTVALNNTANAVVCNAAKTYSESSIPAINVLASDAPWVICVKLVDGATNTTYGKSQEIIRDTVAPTFTSLAGANGASDGFINATEAASNLPLLVLTATGADLTHYSLILDNTPSVTCDASQTYAQTVLPLISEVASDDSWAVCVRLKDNAGNTTYGKSQAIVRDTVPPVFTSLVKVAEAADGSINDSEKNQTSALWSLTANGQDTTAYSAALDDSSGTLTCNASKTYNQGTTIPNPTNFSGDGIWTLCVQLSDNAGNATYGKGESIVRDVAPPSVTSFNGSGAGSNGFINDSEKLLVSALWTLVATGQSSVDYTIPLLDPSAAVTCNGGQTYDQASISGASVLSSDGIYVLCARLTDASGNVAYAKAVPIVRDVIAPTFTSMNGAAPADDLFIGSGEENSSNPLFTLSGSGYVSDDFTEALNDTAGALTCDGTKTYGNATIPSVSSITSDGPWAVCAKLSDAAGNSVYGKSPQLVRDVMPPTFISLIGANSASDAAINDSEKASTAAAWVLSASGQTNTAYTVALDDTASALVCNASKTYNQATVPQIDSITSDGTWAVCVKLTDLAGNASYGKSQSIVRDTAAPVFTSLLGANEASDGFVSGSEAGSTSPLLTLVSTGATAENYSLALDDTAPVSCDASQTYGQSAVPLINSLGADKSYAVCVKLADAAGNVSYGKSQAIVKDTAGPSFTSLAKTAEGSDGYINNSEKLATSPLWVLTAGGAVATDYSLALDDTGGSQICNAAVTYSQASTVANAAALATDGAYTLCVRLTDSAGNATYGKGEPIIRDIVAPIFTSLSVANAASPDSYINGSEYLLTSAMWTLTASGATATQYTLALDDATPVTCNGAQTYSQSAIANPSSLSSDGVYALCVKLMDAAGNTTYGKSAQVTRDIVAPTFSSFIGANEAGDGYIKSGEQSSGLALLTLIASGHVSDDFTVALDDTGGSLVCNSSKTYSFPNIPMISSIATDGVYAVCVKLIDAAGNASYGKSNQIIRDIVGPVFTSLNRANAAADGYIAYGERTSSSAAWTLTASGQITTNYTLALDDTASAVVCDASKTYSNSSVPLISSLATDGPWAACVKLADAAGNFSYGKSQQIIRDTVAPSVVTGLSASAGNTWIDLKWTASSGSPSGYLLVRGPNGSAPTFVPTDGTSYSTGIQGSDQIVSVSSSTLKFDSNLPIGVNLSYKVFAFDAALTYAAGTSVSAVPLTPCASGYVFVPGDPDFGSKGFCLMQYEAKNSAGVASSQATSTPWASIAHSNALTECSKLGLSYRLIQNEEWMTVASHVAALPNNWTGAAVGTGKLFSGHSDSSPAMSCAASANSSLFYVESGCTPVGTGDTTEQKRIFTLSSGEVIWDLAGNAFEWVNYFNVDDKPGATASTFPYPSLSPTPTLPLRALVPTHALKSYWVDSWNQTQQIGEYFGDTNGIGGAMSRGGSYNLSALTGLFSADLSMSLTISDPSISFRCVQTLPHLEAPNLALAPGPNNISVSWTSVGGATGYMLVRGPVDAQPTFQPLNGTAHTGAQGADTIVYRGSSLTYNDSGLEAGRTYYYALYSFDGSTTYASPIRSAGSPLSCPRGFVQIPNDASYGTGDFCVMKYEAKNVGGVAASQASAKPWTSIEEGDALTSCSAMGPAYNLLSNAQWMAIGAHIAARGSNWSSGTVGSGNLQAGHSDNDPAYACPASSNDSLAWVEGSCSAKGTGEGENAESSQRRTLSLANGGVLWDMSGNVSEWVNAFNNNDKPNPSGSFFEFTSLTQTVSSPLKSFVPTNTIKSFWSDSWNSTQRIGQYLATANGTGGSYSRGSNAVSGIAYAGYFSTDLSLDRNTPDSLVGFRCSSTGLASTTPPNFVASAGKNSVSLSWDRPSSSISGYMLVRGQIGKLPVFQPSDGTTYTAGVQGNDTIVYVGQAKFKLDSGLSMSGTYHYHLYAYDAGHFWQAPTLASVSLNPCEQNYVFVPGDSEYGTSDFCLMKYEAKNDGSTNAISQATGTPYASITQYASLTKCSALGTGYHLVSNDEWMSVSANIAALGSNWSGGTVGSGYLFQGHTDNTPAMSCAASSDDTLFYVESTCTPVASGDTSDQRRTFTLSTGQLVWDVSGNVWEWVNHFNANYKLSATNAWVESMAMASSTPQMLRTQIFPSAALKSFWVDTWSSTQKIGMYYPGITGTGGMTRGGVYNGASNSGLFAATLSTAPSSSAATTGFRCVQGLGDKDTSTFALSPSGTSLVVSAASTGASSYLLTRGSANSESSFSPVDGMSYGTGSQGADTILSTSVAALSFTNSALTTGSTYSYALFANDGSDNYNLIARGSEKVMSCASGFVLVPGDLDYGTEDFCAMKYEAKNSGSNAPAADPTGTPWVSIAPEESKTMCAAMGLGYHLMTNDEWMTIGANAIKLGSNWTGASVGSGSLYVGHTDGVPSGFCAASSNDTLNYAETSCTFSTGSSDQRRTFNLSNGGVIWDLSGNVADAVDFVNISDKPNAATSVWIEYDSVVGTNSTALRQLVPSKPAASPAWTSTQGIGKYNAAPNASGGAMLRGGFNGLGSANEGLFSVSLSTAPSYAFTNIGFRCSK